MTCVEGWMIVLQPTKVSLVVCKATMGLLTWDALLTLVIAVAVFMLLLDLMYRRQRWAARYPPGPVALPGLGNLLQIDLHNVPCSFYKFRHHFGDVFSLQLAWNPVVVFNGLAAVREVLVDHSDNTADRPPMPILEHLGFGPRSQGLIMAHYGPSWREQRRFSLFTLRHFGLGKKSLEQWVTEEASCLCTAFATWNGRPFSPQELLNRAVCNVIASLIYARRFEYDDPLLGSLLYLLERTMKEGLELIPQVLNAFPVLLRIPGATDRVLPAQKAFLALIDELVAENRATLDLSQPPQDLTDAFLGEVEKAKRNSESSFNDENLRLVVADLFAAGMVSTSTTLAWALLLMILHPDVQRETSWCWMGRVQQEIDEVIGQGRLPEMGDQTRMPYTSAVIHEVQRFGDILPVTFPHVASRDIEVQGFLIPKGTGLIMNLSSVLKDETVWEKPFHFYPEHFLNTEGQFVKHEAFMPFSAGRRECLGKPLARMELFLFFTCLLQRFSFSVPEGQPPPSDHGVFGFLNTPSPYQLCAVSR